MRVLIAGGGTGGHIYPAISIAKELKKRDKKNEILFIGALPGVGSSVIEEEGFEFRPISAIGWERRLSIRTFGFICSLFRGFWQSARYIFKFRPDMVVGMGGYSSGPPLLLSSMFGHKTIIHEQNSIPGLANRILGRWVKRVATSFKDDDGHFPSHKVVVTGNPVRSEIAKIPKEEALERFGLEEERLTILIFGGSRGAHSINVAVIECLDQLNEIKDKIQMIYVSGREDHDWVKGKTGTGNFPIHLTDFLFDMPAALGAADLVIARAGAGTIAEITCCGLPSILIPYPYATSNHQFKNAYLLELARAAIVILDKELNGQILARTITELVNDRERQKEMGEKAKTLSHPEAASKIVDLIYELAR